MKHKRLRKWIAGAMAAVMLMGMGVSIFASDSQETSVDALTEESNEIDSEETEDLGQADGSIENTTFETEGDEETETQELNVETDSTEPEIVDNPENGNLQTANVMQANLPEEQDASGHISLNDFRGDKRMR